MMLDGRTGLILDEHGAVFRSMKSVMYEDVNHGQLGPSRRQLRSRLAVLFSRDPEAIRNAGNLSLAPDTIDFLEQMMCSTTAQQSARVRHVDHRALLDGIETNGRYHRYAARLGIPFVEASPTAHPVVRHFAKARLDVGCRHHDIGNA